jgi:hypothetical protein
MISHFYARWNGSPCYPYPEGIESFSPGLRVCELPRVGIATFPPTLKELHQSYTLNDFSV